MLGQSMDSAALTSIGSSRALFSALSPPPLMRVGRAGGGGAMNKSGMKGKDGESL